VYRSNGFETSSVLIRAEGARILDRLLLVPLTEPNRFESNQERGFQQSNNNLAADRF
jgi:hypothetical protein